MPALRFLNYRMNLLLLLPPALAILLGVRLVFGPRAAEKSGMLRRVLLVSGLLLIWISVLGILVAMSNYLSVFSVIAVAMVIVRDAMRILKNTLAVILASTAQDKYTQPIMTRYPVESPRDA